MSGTIQFGELARHIDTDHPIYGVQAKGLDGIEKPLDRVEDMAKLYLNTLRSSGLTGPYILIGYSFGGLIALEIAQRLSADGRPVSMLIMLDTYPHPRFMPASQRVRLWVNRINRHADTIRALPWADAIVYPVRLVKNRFWQRKSAVETAREDTAGLSLVRFDAAALRRVKERAYWAYRHYRPKFYPGQVKFVTTSVKSSFPENPESVWAHLVDQLEVTVIPGDHRNIVSTHFIGLASLLTAYVERG